MCVGGWGVEGAREKEYRKKGWSEKKEKEKRQSDRQKSRHDNNMNVGGRG